MGRWILLGLALHCLALWLLAGPFLRRGLLQLWHYQGFLRLQSLSAGLVYDRDRSKADTLCFPSFLRTIVLRLLVVGSCTYGASGHFVRIGEAAVPGPGLLRVTTSNPSGLRGKECHLVELGAGIHCISESQLSTVTLPRCCTTLQAQAASLHRHVRVLAGPPVACRPGSRWAGTWAGVLTMSDLPSQELKLPWRSGELESGRLQASIHYLGHVRLQVLNSYGFCRGPTWPQAKELTERLLQTATQHLVIGGFGPRIICGDFNFSDGELDAFEVWKHYGWVSAQTFAAFHWGHQVLPTCKGTTERDFLWLSPEAQHLCRQVHVFDIFQEHSTVAADLSLDVPLSQVYQWPLPALIPWTEVQLDAWQGSATFSTLEGTTTECYSQVGRALETSLVGHIPTQPGHRLLPTQVGRCQRLAPTRTREQAKFCRASRAGEVELRCDLTTRAVRLWFKQLRRLQSLRHSLRAGAQHWEAQLHRCELWSAILHARGFDGGFRTFWSMGYSDGRPHVPEQLPEGLPSSAQLEQIYETFRARFEALESWHIRQRCRLLKQKHDATMAGLFGELKRAPKAKPDLLWFDHYYTILGYEQDTCSLHLDRPLDLTGRSTWTLNGTPLSVLEADQDTCIVSHLPSLLPGDELHQHQVLTQLEEVHDAFVQFWQPRWNAYKDISDSDWARITTFARAHMRPLHLELPPLAPDQWHRTLARYKPTAARGVDGISHLDLINMPQPLETELLAILDRVETGEAWPQQACFGVVQALAKVDGAHEVSAFRPVVVLSLLYRTWSSLRSRQLLSQLVPVIPEGQVGFIPGQEAMNVWALWMAMIDLCCQGGSTLCGLSADLVRAFNCIPRAPLFWLASFLGIPERVVHPWRNFVEDFSRSFMIRGTLSEAVTSSVGFPEGCALSVLGMCLLDLMWHSYAEVLCPGLRIFSYVDNLGLTARDAGHLALGFATMQAFFTL